MDERTMVGMLSDMVAYSISEDDIQVVLVECDGDMSKALDELLNLKMIREMNDAASLRREDTKRDGQLQWNLFTTELESYGLDDATCRELIRVLKEQRGGGKLSSSAIVLELLDSMDVVSKHPTLELQERYPTIPLSIIEEAFEHNNCDLQATIKALVETKALLTDSGTYETFSYASVVKPSASGAPTPPPPVNCKHEFPTLTKLQLGKTTATSTVWHESLHGLPTGGRGTLTTRMKLEFLQSSFPSIDSDILCAALLVSNSSVVAAEAMLQSTFPAACTAADENVADAERTESHSLDEVETSWKSETRGFAFYQQRTVELQEEMQTLHTEALRKLGGKGQHHLGVERTRRLASLRAKLQETREHAAYAFFVENQLKLVNGIAIDLHGLYVQEAYQVLEYCVSFCRDHKISKFVLVTGVGNHSKTRGGRMYTTFPAALRRRRITFSQDGGQLTVYPCQPLRS